MRLILGLLVSGLVFLFSQSRDKAVDPIQFNNVARAAGLEFRLENNPTPEKHAIETMPGGVAAFDYDGDGLTDIYLTNGAAIPSMEKVSPKFYNRLYRNLGRMKFADVTEQAAVQGAGYSMGVAVADYNNDGHIDIFIAGVNRNILYHNTGKGKFEDATVRSGIRSPLWSVAAGWFDYDNDGWLDLFIVNYAKWSLAYDRFCGDREKNLRVYCHPKYFEGLPNTLYRNRGDGSFEDVSAKTGILKHASKGMSVAFADYDQNGYADAFVTNDTLPNFLFRNRGNGTLEETALAAGAALLEHGKPVSCMGVDFRDYDNDGLPDIGVTALAGETFPLFRNDGKGFFTDATFISGLSVLSAPRSGWSNGFFDFNNDGWKDLFSANSHVNDLIEQFEATQYKQPNSVFANMGGGRFRDVSRDAGEAFQAPKAHRGSAFADFNNDGRMDVVVTALGDEAELWQNASSNDSHWLLVKPIGTRSNRDGIGARIRIESQSNLMTTSVGYASSTHHGVHFGLGKISKIAKIEIVWPSGKVQVVRDVAADQVLQIREPSN